MENSAVYSRIDDLMAKADEIKNNTEQTIEDINNVALNLPRNVKEGAFTSSYYSRATSQPYDATRQMCSVQGKGFLYYAMMLDCISSANLSIQIILDGKTMTIGQTARGGSIGFISKESIISSVPDNSLIYFSLIQYTGTSNNGMLHLDLSGFKCLTKEILLGEVSGYGLHMSDYAIPFYNSLQVIGMVGGNGYFAYELID